MVDAAGTTAYGYAAGGQLWTEDGPFASDTVTNLYSNRLRTGLGLAQPTGAWTNGFGYDAMKRLTNVSSRAGSFAYTYHASRLPLPIKISLPNSGYITNTYDNTARLTGTWLKKSDHSNLDYATYGYNAGNQRTWFTNGQGGGAYTAYTYDPIGQLKVSDSSANAEDRGYFYDAAWNLNYRTNNGTLNTFVVDDKNQLTNAPTVGTQGYDPNGNLITVGSGTNWLYEYDDENRLVECQHFTNGLANYQNGDRRTQFVYDGRGRLRQRLEYELNVPESPSPAEYWSLLSETRYVYDGMRVIQERNGNNTPTVSYTRGNDLSGSLEGAGGIGGLLARTDGYSSGNWSTNNFYHADGNGNITYLVSTNQTRSASYLYDPYGNAISSGGSLAGQNVYRFSSKEIHLNSGLYYYGYRWYAPNLQRWLNRDPIEELGGINLYRFVRNNPINEQDSFGLLSAACTAARQALADALRNFNQAPGPLTQAALVAAVAAEAAACSGEDKDPPLPPPTPLPKCKPVFEPTRPRPTSPPYQNNQGGFCQRHPVICIGGAVVVVGGIIVLSGGTAAPVLVGGGAAVIIGGGILAGGSGGGGT